MLRQHLGIKAGSTSRWQDDIRHTLVRQGLKAWFGACNGQLGCILPDKWFEFLAAGLGPQGCSTGLGEVDCIKVHLLRQSQGTILEKQVIAHLSIGLTKFVWVLGLLCCRPLLACVPPGEVLMVTITITSQCLKGFVVAQQLGALLALGQVHAGVEAHIDNVGVAKQVA